MRTFILIGRNRKTGKSDLICDETVPIGEQLAKRKELAQSRVNDEFSYVRLIEVHDSKSKLKFITTDEDNAEKKRLKDAHDLKAKVQAEENKNATTLGGKRKPKTDKPKTESGTESSEV